MDSRKRRFVETAVSMALDPEHGYSQKPPSGRWGPDYDCSSFVYEVADKAGYSVGRENDDGKVRWTGTMTKDFKDAGFQLLPFANVGVSGLEIGDILLNLAVHAEVYLGGGASVGALNSEDGDYAGEAGDQTGNEISIHPLKDVPVQWNFILRPPDEESEGDGNMVNYPNGYPGYPRTTYSSTYGQGYNQGYGMYPQGNLGQMNGYSQANAGSWPQAGSQQPGAKFVSGVQEANERFVPAGVTECFLTNDWKHLIVKSADQQGYPTMRVFDIQECMEDMGQHGYSQGYPQGGEIVTRQEFEQLKEMLQNVQSAISDPAGHVQGANGPANANVQPNGRSGRNA